MSDGLKYGYESSLSADQKQRGVADPGLVMAVFYGKKGATYEAAIIGESTPEILSCTDDCQYIKSVTMFDGEPIRETYMHNDGQSIASGIMRDAIAGKLKQYEGTHSYSEASGKYKNHHEITYEVTEHYRFWMADGHITRTLVATERKPTDNQQD